MLFGIKKVVTFLLLINSIKNGHIHFFLLK